MSSSTSPAFRPDDILGPDGFVAKRLKSYEVRHQQLEMANAVSNALSAKKHLVVEAGTGTGKSFAYLVPAILKVCEEQANQSSQDEPNRIVISTHTISLQEQLIQKDIPFLNSIIPLEFSAVLVKGRGNYLSLRRLHNALERSGTLFHRPEDADLLQEIRSWARNTTDGSLADFPFRPTASVWDEVASDSGNCLGRKCPTFKRCFYYQARNRIKNAQILIVNHALFFSDLALRQVKASIIPDYQAVIFDEAHTLEAVASDHMGLRVTSGQIDYTLNKLYNDRTNKGILVGRHLAEAEKQVNRCRERARDFFTDLDYWREEQGENFNGRIAQTQIVPNGLSPELDQLARMVRTKGESLSNESDRQDFVSAADRLDGLSTELSDWLGQHVNDGVYWMERTETRRQAPRISLAAAPIDIGSLLREQLFQQKRTCILTSATLSVGKMASFDYFQDRIGLTQTRSLQLDSPFDYQKQAKIIVLRGMPDPSSKADYERLTAAMIERYVKRTDGRAFALFTSYDMLRRVASRIAPALREEDIAIYTQEAGMSRGHLLDQFKANPRSLLMGTDSFWQGVDVPGEALSNVIITKLPFSVPDQPLLQARLEAIRKRGGNPFQEHQLPEAIIKLKQGFGRLIRTRSDTGIVVILDPRIRTKYYGRFFLESLPECKLVEESVTADSYVD
ncbi:MAG: helicase C-terminal domain-containing protein [Pirellulaceae bacterium]